MRGWSQAAIAGTVLLAGCGGTSHSLTASQPATTQAVAKVAPAPAPTQNRIFTAVSPSGSPTIKVTSSADGECWEGSLLTPRAEAWRCTVNNYIEDPCFTSGYETVVCPTGGPWTGAGVEVRLETPVSSLSHRNTGKWPSGASPIPWALQLADGSDCLLASGATSVVDGMRQNYECKPGGLWLYGDPDRSSPVWTIFGGSEKSSELTERPVAIAWF